MALYAMVSSDGELQLFTPVADDDHVDATAGRRGGVPAIAIQVKTASEVDRYGLVEAKADYRVGYVREHPAFLYVVLLMNSITVEVAWLLPSTYFNRLAYKHIDGDREILAFRGDPGRNDSYSKFRVPPLELGPRLLSFIDSNQQRIPPDFVTGTSGLMGAARRTDS